MQSKSLLGRTLLIVALAGLILSAALLVHFIPKKSTQAVTLVENAIAPQTKAKSDSGSPIRLKIPSINVDASLRPVGLAPDGTMVAPKGPDDVVWYERGARPGEKGSAVIAGHYGTWKNGSGSVFDNLSKLKLGDNIYVNDEKGARITFVVREIRSYDPNADASAVFESNDGEAHLNLITCEGAWNKVSKSYPKRLVVFTDKE